MMPDIESIYNEYLDSENKKKDHKNQFYASNAGSCFRKQYYHFTGAYSQPFDIKTKRLLRLGTIVHNDFENAIQWYVKSNPDDNIVVLTEHRIQIDSINVRGRVDYAFIVNNIGHISDFKTIGAYPWRKRFGRKENRDPEPSARYCLQVGTYALGLAQEENVDDVTMGIVWYNKNNSQMKYDTINPEWAGKALKYWEDCNEAVKSEDNLIPGTSEGVPMDPKWECNYCNYNDMCDSMFIKKKK